MLALTLVASAVDPFDSPQPETCADITCSGDESCCRDSPGCTGACSECCVDVSTYCVGVRPGFTTSTCCPRWTVGCSVGSVGCCDPARPWQKLGAPSNTSLLQRKPAAARRDGAARGADDDHPLVEDMVEEVHQSTTGPTAYALFTRNYVSGLQALTIEPSSGKVLSKRLVSGVAAEYLKGYYGESTRLLPWDGSAARWVFADIDRSAHAQPLKLYTIDAASGSSTAVEVTGCGGGYPVGQAWDAASDGLVLGMQTSTEASFCLVSVAGGGTPLGRVARGAGESDAAYYAAYISVAEAKVLSRVGTQIVSEGKGEGVATTTPGQGAEWAALPPGAHGLPVSAQVHPAGGLVGLAPRAGGALDVVGFGDKAGAARLLATLDDLNLPRAMGITLGYVGDSVAGETYAALGVQLKGGVGLGDKWAIASVSLARAAGAAGATNATQLPLSPQPSVLGAETVALSGFGLSAAPAPHAA